MRYPSKRFLCDRFSVVLLVQFILSLFGLHLPLECFVIISIFYGCMLWIGKSVTRVTDRHHKACRVMPISDLE